MKPRDLLLIGAVVVLLGALAAVALGPGAEPVLGAAPANAPGIPADRQSELPPAAMDAVASGAPEGAPASARESATAAEATSGVVRGHVSLDAGIVERLGRAFVRVQEAVEPSDGTIPFQQTLGIEIRAGARTPEFRFDDVPFSPHGYAVSVYAEGVNGSEQFVSLTREEPVADVALSLTGGVPFTVLARDQLLNPVPDTRVYMVPVGKPLGRPLLQGETDSFGAAVFEDVQQGTWDIRVGSVNQPRNEPCEVQVLSHAGVRSAAVEVPRGHPVEVRVSARGGWGVEGARLVLFASDTVQMRRYESETDYAGRHVFEHLPSGSYTLNITHDRFQNWTRKVEVPESGRSEPVEAALFPR